MVGPDDRDHGHDCGQADASGAVRRLRLGRLSSAPDRPWLPPLRRRPPGPAAGVAGRPGAPAGPLRVPGAPVAPYRHAGHYLGFTTNLPVRWPQHLAGGYDPATHKSTGRGARLLAAAIHAGCTVELVRVWYGTQARALEQRLKQRRKSGSLRAGAAGSLK